MNQIWLSPPSQSGEEEKYLKEALATNWLAPFGTNIEAFAQQLGSYYDGLHVLLTNSGTSAIHLSLLAQGIGQGDIVLLPTLNFAGCVNPVCYTQAEPVFVDSDASTWNMDPAVAEEAIADLEKQGKKPKALIAVHLFGMPAKVHELKALCDKHGIVFIEDAADAIGSRHNGKLTGTFGSAGILSFNGNKIITTAGGGALLSRDKDLVERSRHLANQAGLRSPHYLHDTVGYNYLLSNVLAGIGRAQFPALDKRIARRRQIYDNYSQLLSSAPAFRLKPLVADCQPNFWLTIVNIEGFHASQRDQVVQRLALQGIESRPVWTPMHMQPAFARYKLYSTGVAEQIFSNGICLPSGNDLTDAQQEFIVSSLLDAYQQVAMPRQVQAVQG